MKKIFFLFLILHFINLSGNIVNSQTRWVWQSPTPSAVALGKVFFLNANTCWVQSSYGRISKSTNGGLNWIDQSWQNNNGISGIFFINAQTGWAVGTNGLIIKSTNGGTNWAQQTSNTSGGLYCVQFINTMTGWIGGGWNNFLRTTNGGTNWIFSNQIGDEIYSMCFINSMTGWLSCSNSHLQKTTDGGATFETIISPNFYNNEIIFKNENTGWYTGSYGGYGLYKTTNAGVNWNVDSVPGLGGGAAIYFKDVNTGWIMSTLSRIYCTTNGGDSWGDSIFAQSLPFVNFLYFSDLNTGYLGGGVDFYTSGPQFKKTTNGGLNWNNLVWGNNYMLKSVSVVNSRNAFITGIYNCLEKTTNGGIGWENNLNNYGILNSIFFVNARTGWAAGWTSDGNYSTLIKTTNSGLSWFNQDSTFRRGYLCLHFLSTNYGWAAGNNVIAMTSNGGTSWQKLSGYDTTNSYQAIQFVNVYTGWTVYTNTNNKTGILKTTNSGINWINQYASTNGGIKTLHFVNTNTGYAADGINGILKTTNGGNNWNLINTTLTGINSINFVNSNSGWLVGYDGNAGIIAKTTNGGTSFNVLPTLTSNSLNCVRFSNTNVGWIVGDRGVILKTTSGGITFESTSSEDVPKKFLLLQNYPNPFNPTTSIKYSVSSIQNVKLIVCDILGKEVATLVNEKLQPGTYEVTFDGSRLASGIYFYTLLIENVTKLGLGNESVNNNSRQVFKETKKMLLVK